MTHFPPFTCQPFSFIAFLIPRTRATFSSAIVPNLVPYHLYHQQQPLFPLNPHQQASYSSTIILLSPSVYALHFACYQNQIFSLHLEATDSLPICYRSPYHFLCILVPFSRPPFPYFSPFLGGQLVNFLRSFGFLPCS